MPASPEAALSVMGYDVEKVLTYAVMATGMIAAALIAAPMLLPQLGIGEKVAEDLIDNCCKTIGNDTGIAGNLAKIIESIPVVGTYLTTEGSKNILVPAVTILGGHVAGNAVEQIEHERGGKGVIGSAIRVTSLGLGVVLSLPALLPGIAHATVFLGDTLGLDETGHWLGRTIGNTTECPIVRDGVDLKPGMAVRATIDTAKVGASVLAAHLPCALPMLLAGAPAAGAVIGNHTARLRNQSQESPAQGLGL